MTKTIFYADNVAKQIPKPPKQTTEIKAKLSHSMLARRAPILCLVGLVGTGKTTLAKSIAQAMGRRFVRIPFGGMSDALDLRGQSRVRPDAEGTEHDRGGGQPHPCEHLPRADCVPGQCGGGLVEQRLPHRGGCAGRRCIRGGCNRTGARNRKILPNRSRRAIWILMW